MKKAIILLSLLWGMSNSALAQKPITGSEATKIETEIEQQTSQILTLENKFKQEKHMNGMSKNLVSTGTMRYKKNGKVRLDYVTPFKYELTVNGDKVKMATNGKKNIYNASSNPGMQEMQKMLSASMTGDIAALKSKYAISYFDNGSTYLIKIKPIKPNKMIQEIEMELNKSDKMLIRMRLTEVAKAGKTGNDYTEYTFSDTKKNTTIDDSVFAIE